MDRTYPYITFASVVSAIAVVSLHANACFWFYSEEPYWFSANIIESLFYFAVPVFFMISGATLLDFGERYSLKEYFQRRFRKTVFPFLCWSILGLIYCILIKRVQISELNPFFIYNGIVNTTFVNYYWFFPPLFCVYLCIPLFAAVPKEKRRPLFTYLAGTGFVLNVVLPFFIKLFCLDISFPFSVSVAGGYLFYVITGYLLHTCPCTKRSKLVIYALSLGGFLVHACGTYIISRRCGFVVSTYKGYVSLPAVLYSVGIFVFLKDLGTSVMMKTHWHRAIHFLGKYTFSLYLTHFYFLELFRHLVKGFLPDISLLYRVLAPCFVVVCVVLLISVLRKLPGVKHIVP